MMPRVVKLEDENMENIDERFPRTMRRFLHNLRINSPGEENIWDPAYDVTRQQIQQRRNMRMELENWRAVGFHPSTGLVFGQGQWEFLRSINRDIETMEKRQLELNSQVARMISKLKPLTGLLGVERDNMAERWPELSQTQRIRELFAMLVESHGGNESDLAQQIHKDLEETGVAANRADLHVLTFRVKRLLAERNGH